ncbi:MAG: hypothetical protein KDC56_11310 [Flavobacteriaceae bacterium]|nr:hypothetical protein [Candidatus Nomurabacteria bacterium]MCB0473636.1 hypothetical protein [Flavobacteriaceae bacterium]
MISSSDFTNTVEDINRESTTTPVENTEGKNKNWVNVLIALFVLIAVGGILWIGKTVGNNKISSSENGSVAYTDFGTYSQYKVTGSQFLYVANAKYNNTFVNTAHAKGTYTTTYRDNHGKMKSQVVTFDHDNKTPIKGDPESYDFDIEDGYVIVKLY